MENNSLSLFKKPQNVAVWKLPCKSSWIIEPSVLPLPPPSQYESINQHHFFIIIQRKQLGCNFSLTFYFHFKEQCNSEVLTVGCFTVSLQFLILPSLSTEAAGSPVPDVDECAMAGAIGKTKQNKTKPAPESHNTNSLAVFLSGAHIVAKMV